MYAVRSSRVIVWGFLYGLRAFCFIHFLGERLTPDSGLYARGGGWYSSPALAISGSLAGYTGVCMAGIVGATALGSIVARNSRGILRPSAVALLPPGWYTIQPSADACSSAVAAWSYGRDWRSYHLALLTFFHVEAALVVLGSRIIGHYWFVRMDIVAIALGVLVWFIPHSPEGIGHLSFHIQIRYLLPGLAMWGSHEAHTRSVYRRCNSAATTRPTVLIPTRT